MSVEADLVASLIANATLKTAMGGTVRLEPAPLRHAQTLPAITWMTITRIFEQAVNRTVQGKLTHFQFDVWDDDAVGAEAVSAALQTALLAFTTSAHSLSLMGEYDVPEPDDTGINHRALIAAILT